ncbi:ankyrin repeat-containing protein [Tanacetum coccineum]
MEGQALSWFCLGQRFYVWEGLKRRLLERFQPSQEGTLYEQLLAITQEGSAREYVSLFETLVGQLVGIPEQVMEGTFIKGLRPKLWSGVQVMQPEGLNHAMKLAMIIDENKAQSSSHVEVPIEGKTTIKGGHFRRMTKSELEERRAKGLCFCDAENEPYLQVKPWDHIKAEVNAKMEQVFNTNNLANDINEHKLGHRPIKVCLHINFDVNTIVLLEQLKWVMEVLRIGEHGKKDGPRIKCVNGRAANCEHGNKDGGLEKASTHFELEQANRRIAEDEREAEVDTISSQPK